MILRRLVNFIDFRFLRSEILKNFVVAYMYAKFSTYFSNSVEENLEYFTCRGKSRFQFLIDSLS